MAPFGTVWTWVPRERNSAADRLANLAMDAAARGEVNDVRAASLPGDEGEARLQENQPGEAKLDGNQPGDPTPAAMEPLEPAGSESETSTSADDAATESVGRGRNLLVGWSGMHGEPTTMVFLRHGETKHTAALKFSGPGGDDPGLNNAGRAQARRAAQALATDGGFDALISSPMRRTRETARAVSEALGLSIELADGYREVCLWRVGRLHPV
ncbi:MAG: histidine phosphatase family protein [Nocardioidaceae bacterium]